jgi:hypothetical protein
MSQEELESGKQIVEQLLKHLCAESDITLGSSVVWHKDFDNDRYWLEVEFDGRSVKWPLSFEQLEDSVADESVRRKIESGLRRFVVPTGGGTRSEAESKTTRIELQGATEADVFISHATEDKPLVKALEAAGIRVWYDRMMLEWGDDLRSSIDRGLANCGFGIVLFSKAFLSKKKWTEYELNALFAREKAGKKVILPIWHGVTRDDLLLYSPAFADRLAKISSNDGYDDIVSTFKRMLGKDKLQEPTILPAKTPDTSDTAIPPKKANAVEPNWIMKRKEEAAEAKRKEADNTRRLLDAVRTIEAGGPDFWKRLTDRVLVNVQTLPELGEELYGSAPCSNGEPERNCHIIVERRSVKHGADSRQMNLWYAPGSSHIRCYYQNAKQDDILLRMRPDEIVAEVDGKSLTAEHLGDELVETMVEHLKPKGRGWA